MLQNIGIYPGRINYPLWQLSCLIVGSHMLLSLMKWDKQLTINVICPLLSIGTCTYLANSFGSGEPNFWGVENRFVYIPLIRSAGSLALGMFAYYSIKKCLTYLGNRKSGDCSMAVSAIGIMMLLAFWVNRESYISILPFLIMMLSMLYSESIFLRCFIYLFYKKLISCHWLFI